MPALVIERVNRRPTANEPRVEKELALEPAKFEVASIKPATPDNQMTGLRYQGGSTMRAGGTLRNLISMSLQVSSNFEKDIAVGLPKFADKTHWEINAKVPTTGEGAPNVERLLTSWSPRWRARIMYSRPRPNPYHSQEIVNSRSTAKGISIP